MADTTETRIDAATAEVVAEQVKPAAGGRIAGCDADQKPELVAAPMSYRMMALQPVGPTQRGEPPSRNRRR